MSKGLEALNHIKECAEQLNIKGIPTLFQKECYNNIEKELKALEIIMSKRVNVCWFLRHKYLHQYNWNCAEELTQEEYDLLKEVLL